MNQQRKIIRYKKAVLKIVPSGDSGYMEWRAILSSHPRIQFNDPTSASYSVGGMKFWLSYGKDDVHDYLLYEKQRKAGLVRVPFWAHHEPTAINRFTGQERWIRARRVHVRSHIRLDEYVRRSPIEKPIFRVSKAVWEARWKQQELLREERTGIPSQYLLSLKEQEQKEREQNGSISGREGKL